MGIHLLGKKWRYKVRTTVTTLFQGIASENLKVKDNSKRGLLYGNQKGKAMGCRSGKG